MPAPAKEVSCFKCPQTTGPQAPEPGALAPSLGFQALRLAGAAGVQLAGEWQTLYAATIPCTLNSCSGSVQTFSGVNPARLPSSWNSAIEYLQEISVWMVSPGAKSNRRPAMCTNCEYRLSRCISTRLMIGS